MRSQPATRSFSAAAAPSCASEMKPTSTTSTSSPSARSRSDTRAADRRSCGSRSGNCGQYAPSPPATSPTVVRREVVRTSPPGVSSTEVMTAPLLRGDAPAQERGRPPGVDGYVPDGGVGQVARGEHDDRGSDVLGQDLPLQQGPLRVELAELLLRHAVHSGALRTPAARKDPRAADDTVRVHPVDLDAVLA